MIDEANLRFYRSANDGLGGPPTSVPVRDGLFGEVRAVDAEVGLTDYRCLYFMNVDPDKRGLLDPAVWIALATDAGQLAIGIDTGGKNHVAATLANSKDAPPGVVFRSPQSWTDALDLPGAPYLQDDFVAIWARRTVPKGAKGPETFNLRIRGESMP